MNQNWDESNNVLDLSLLLNKLLQEYYNKTKYINSLLEQDSEESIITIDQILQERDAIIKQYNTIREKFERVLPQTGTTDLDHLKVQRDELLELIRSIELVNLHKSNELSDNYKSKIREINKGKKAVRAYTNEGPLADGFFVDKRK